MAALGDDWHDLGPSGYFGDEEVYARAKRRDTREG